MAERKSDLVRRSLFGPDPVATDDKRSEVVAKPLAKQARQQTGRPRRTSQPAVSTVRQAEVVSPAPIRRGPVERTAVTVPSDLLLRVKDAVAVLNGWPHQYTMARFVEEAFTAQLERLKIECNGGQEFPETNRKIRTGRPPGS
jgi:hypothetical protein